MSNISKELYGAYQFHWMTSHGYTLNDFVSQMTNYFYEYQEEDGNGNYEDFIEDVEPDSLMNDVIYESGFDGEMFVSYNEFMENEYEDQGYMAFLCTMLPDPVKGEAEYNEDIEERLNEEERD